MPCECLGGVDSFPAALVLQRNCSGNFGDEENPVLLPNHRGRCPEWGSRSGELQVGTCGSRGGQGAAGCPRRPRPRPSLAVPASPGACRRPGALPRPGVPRGRSRTRGGGGLARPGVAPRAARPSRGRFRTRRRRRGRAPGPRAPAGGGAAAQCGRSQRAPPLSSLPSRDIGERAGLPRRHVPRAAPEAASGAADVAPPPTPLPPAARTAPPLRAARLRKWSCCAALRLRRAARAEGD